MPDFVRAQLDEAGNDDWGDWGEQSQEAHDLSHEVLAQFFENSLTEIAEVLQQEGFEPPSLPLFQFKEETYYKVTIFDFSKMGAKTKNLAVYSDGKMYCNDPGVSRSSFIGVDTRRFHPLVSSDEALLYVVLAHELMHAIQESYPASFNALNGCAGNTKDYMNVNEGTANGVAYKIAMRRWPKYYLTFRSETSFETLVENEQGKETKNEVTAWKFDGGSGHIFPNLIGWRTYQVPFLDLSASRRDEGSQAPYLTGSFWFNLADRYGLRIIDHLFRQPLKHGDNPSLLRWLDEGLESHNQTIGGLYLAFPHFVTEFASQAGSRFPWEEFSALGRDTGINSTVFDRSGKATLIEQSSGTKQELQQAWIKKILGECMQLHLVAGSVETDEVDVELDKVSAACVELTWEGFEENFELNLELESPDLALLDQVQTGLVYEENEQQEKFCYDWVQTGYSEPLRTCLHEKPFTKTGPQQLNYIKNWREDGMKFTGTGRRFIAISNVAKRPDRTKRIESGSGVKLRAGVFKATGMDGREYDPPAAGPTGSGSVTAGPETLYGISKHPAGASIRLGFSIPVKNSDLQYGIHWTGVPPATGYSGPYKGTVSRPASGSRAISSSICSRHADGVVGQITRFDRDHLWVDIDADLCEMTLPPPISGRYPKVDELKVSLRIPFGWRYSAENSPVDIVTPGMQVFIDRHARRLPLVLSGRWTSPGAGGSDSSTSITSETTGSGQSGSSSGATAGNRGIPSTLAECNCSCEEYEGFKEAGTSAKSNNDQDALMSLSGQMMACMSQCQQQYMICLLDAQQ